MQTKIFHNVCDEKYVPSCLWVFNSKVYLLLFLTYGNHNFIRNWCLNRSTLKMIFSRWTSSLAQQNGCDIVIFILFVLMRTPSSWEHTRGWEPLIILSNQYLPMYSLRLIVSMFAIAVINLAYTSLILQFQEYNSLFTFFFAIFYTNLQRP